MNFKNRDVISVKDFSKKEINDILNYAKKMIPYAKGEKNTDILKEKILSSLFFEPSTRTRLSFESAMHRLGGNVIGFADPNATIEGDELVIRNETAIELTPDEGRNVIFNWNLTGTSKGNYTISAAANVVPGEIVTANNNYTCAWIIIAMTGDIT